MMYALFEDKRILARPGLQGFCPLCESELISKCGEVKIWHWAHKANADCDIFKEHESLWHRQWKEQFPESNREVLIKRGSDIHYADIKTDTGTVIEFQNSSINFQKTRERESFYGDRMVWVFNCQNSLDRIDKIGYDLKWWNPRRDFKMCRKNVYLDIGDTLFRVGNIRHEKDGIMPVFFISGDNITKAEFINQVTQITRDLFVVCPHILDGEMVKELPYRACDRHRKDGYDQCKNSYWPWEEERDCQQWRYPFIWDFKQYLKIIGGDYEDKS